MPAYTLRPTGLGRDNDFQFWVDGAPCGRTYLHRVPGGENWCWSIYGTSYLGVVPDDVSLQGAAETREEAAELFKRNWEKLAEAGMTRR